MSVFDIATTIFVYFLIVSRLVQSQGLGELGLWSLVMGYVAFLRMLDPGGAGSVTKFVAGCEYEKCERSSFIDSAALFSLLFFAAAALVGYFPILFFVERSVESRFLSLSAELVVGLLLVLPMNMLALGQLAALDGIGRADLRASISIFATLIYGSIGLSLVSTLGVISLVYGQAIQWLVAFVLARLTLSRHVDGLSFVPQHLSAGRIVEMARFGFRLQMAGIPISLFDALNRILIGQFAGLDRLGLYEIAYKFSLSARHVVQAALGPIYPEFARLLIKDTSAAKAQFAKTSRVAVIAGSCASVLQIASTPLASYLMLGEINVLFILVASALSMAWGLTNIGLPLQFYSRASGVLRWAHFGQWSLLALGVSLIVLAHAILSPVAIMLAPAVAIGFGHLLTAALEARFFKLNPLTRKNGDVALVFLLVFIATASTATVSAGLILSSTR